MQIRHIILTLFAALVTVLPAAAVGSGEISTKSGNLQAAADSNIPVTRVALFSSGVGYFERRGKVDGNAEVMLTVPSADVNDLLKSLTVRDEGGSIQSIDYSSRDPLTRALKSFSIDLSDSPSLATILERARGAEISVKTPQALTGTIISIESRTVETGPQTTQEELYLNLLAADGIHSIRISSLDQILFKDPKLQNDLTAALALIASHRATDTNTLRLQFTGSGSRAIALSYILETPIWKTSYRLSFASAPAANGASGSASNAFIQGWAIIDNPTDDDWKSVSLSLISGMPISFTMNLGEPIYNQRPSEPVPLPPSVQPQTYESGLPAANEVARQKSAPPSVRSAAPSAGALSDQYRRAEAPAPASEPFSLSQGVQSAATGGAAGEFFQYAIKDPVTLPRHQSAMVPIVNQGIEASPVAIYNESVLPRHPLSGLMLTNSTGLHLMAGPITVYEDGVYAGDAEIADLSPGAKRLVSFAVDLDTEVSAESTSSPELITAVKIDRGTLIATRKLQRERDYTVVNRSGKKREVLIEYPKARDWTLIAPEKPAESTPELYRFDVTTDSGGRAALAVKEERMVSQTVALSNIDSQTILYYSNQRASGAGVKRALSTLTNLKSALADLVNQRRAFQDRVDAISKDQSRIRSNMNALQRDSDLYRRYVTILASQEDELAAAAQRIEELSGRISTAQKQIDDFLSTLTVS